MVNSVVGCVYGRLRQSDYFGRKWDRSVGEGAMNCHARLRITVRWRRVVRRLLTVLVIFVVNIAVVTLVPPQSAGIHFVEYDPK